MITKVYYRVRPEHFGFAHEDFDTPEEALKRANERNSLRPHKFYSGDSIFKGRFYKGDNCKIQKVTITIEEITS